MIFSYIKHCKRNRQSCIYLLFLLIGVSTGYAQIVLDAKNVPLAPIIINDYSYEYPDVPSEAVIREAWYGSPNEIAKRIELNNIPNDTKYFEDDTPYLEKMIDGIKGRLFLKEVQGYRYTVLDLQFVPYRDEAGEGVLEYDLGFDGADIISRPSEEYNPSSEDNVSGDEVDEGKNSVPPLFQERGTGVGIVLDLILLDTGDVSRRSKFFRYNSVTKKKEYRESYVYTSKGAIQRLTRRYVDGGVQRYVYYFSTGGLKEIFYQDPDGSSYILNYTLAGDLERKRIYDTQANVTYDIKNTYNETNDLILQDEKDYLISMNAVMKFFQNQITERKIYQMTVKEKEGNDDLVEEEFELDDEVVDSLLEEDIGDQSTGQELTFIPIDESEPIIERELLKTESFKYNPSGEEIGRQQVDVLHEDNVSVEYRGEEKIEVFMRDGKLMSKVLTEGNEKIEVFYFQGLEVLKVYYDKTKKIKEEVINNGVVIETRELD